MENPANPMVHYPLNLKLTAIELASLAYALSIGLVEVQSTGRHEVEVALTVLLGELLQAYPTRVDQP